MAASFLPLGGVSQPRQVALRRPPPMRATRVAAVVAPAVSSDEGSYWTAVNADIEAHLELSLPLRDPPAVHGPFRDLILSAPRTMAPALCVAACDLVGGQREHCVAAAAALHVLYAASQAHEYLPRMRPRPAPAVHDDNVELLSGDGIHPFGYEMVARSIGRAEPERALHVIAEMSRSFGAGGFVLGQYLHVSGSRYAWEKKEGGLFACAAACGAILGGAGEQEMDKLRRFGLYVGMIQGMVFGSGKDVTIDRLQEAKLLKNSALKELEGFDLEKAGPITSLLDV